jgi:hypothetical protein
LGKEIAQEKSTPERAATDTKKKEAGLFKEVKGFTFNMKGCEKSGNFVTCNVSITSNSKDKEITICHYCDDKTMLYDDIGNEYISTKIILGGQWDGGKLERRLVAGVPTIASFEFKEINQAANMATLFEINCRAEREQFSVQFRNIPISK